MYIIISSHRLRHSIHTSYSIKHAFITNVHGTAIWSTLNLKFDNKWEVWENITKQYRKSWSVMFMFSVTHKAAHINYITGCYMYQSLQTRRLSYSFFPILSTSSSTHPPLTFCQFYIGLRNSHVNIKDYIMQHTQTRPKASGQIRSHWFRRKLSK